MPYTEINKKKRNSKKVHRQKSQLKKKQSIKKPAKLTTKTISAKKLRQMMKSGHMPDIEAKGKSGKEQVTESGEDMSDA
eukprot:CAMPEP_0196667588 /NCGR_PEP_ID=MMETSP1086-20130531/65165_1 /TAXON_ID=77921 /ORGANISM="Cyanoptyche  gloeocystis , Strain SAG4.97" /LENGTH=78 /DNA_ID=CAMNT_0042004933 /DNA_START=34 /DNA_END=270 /DNA_ORIENTATION=+